MQIAECKHEGACWSLNLLLPLCHENENQNYSELVKTRRENKTPNFQPTFTVSSFAEEVCKFVLPRYLSRTRQFHTACVITEIIQRKCPFKV
jgi:hypothetical protein